MLLADPNGAEPAVLDFGQVVDAIMVGERGTLSLFNLTLQNAAPRNVLRTDTHARYKIIPFGPWPSLTVLPNATVITLHSDAHDTIQERNVRIRISWCSWYWVMLHQITAPD